MERGGGAGILGKVLLLGSSGGAIVWSADMGSVGANGTEVRGSACGFSAAGHKGKGRVAEGRVVAVGNIKDINPVSNYTVATDIC